MGASLATEVQARLCGPRSQDLHCPTVLPVGDPHGVPSKTDLNWKRIRRRGDLGLLDFRIRPWCFNLLPVFSMACSAICVLMDLHLCWNDLKLSL